MIKKAGIKIYLESVIKEKKKKKKIKKKEKAMDIVCIMFRRFSYTF